MRKVLYILIGLLAVGCGTKQAVAHFDVGRVVCYQQGNIIYDTTGVALVVWNDPAWFGNQGIMYYIMPGDVRFQYRPLLDARDFALRTQGHIARFPGSVGIFCRQMDEVAAEA